MPNVVSWVMLVVVPTLTLVYLSPRLEWPVAVVCVGVVLCVADTVRMCCCVGDDEPESATAAAARQQAGKIRAIRGISVLERLVMLRQARLSFSHEDEWVWDHHASAFASLHAHLLALAHGPFDGVVTDEDATDADILHRIDVATKL